MGGVNCMRIFIIRHLRCRLSRNYPFPRASLGTAACKRALSGSLHAAVPRSWRGYNHITAFGGFADAIRIVSSMQYGAFGDAMRGVWRCRSGGFVMAFVFGDAVRGVWRCRSGGFVMAFVFCDAIRGVWRCHAGGW